MSTEEERKMSAERRKDGGEREKFAEGGRVRTFVGKKDCLSVRIDYIWI